GTLAGSADHRGSRMMSLQDVLYDRQPQARPPFASAAAFVDPVKAFEYPVDVLRRNSFARINNRHLNALLPHVEFDHNFTVIIRMVHGVRYQVTHHLADP